MAKGLEGKAGAHAGPLHQGPWKASYASVHVYDETSCCAWFTFTSANRMLVCNAILLFNRSSKIMTFTCSTRVQYTIHHNRLTVCLPDSLDLDRCLSILFWLSACE